MPLVRKQLYITQKQEREIRQEAGTRGISEAALIRERLDHRCLHQPTDAQREAARRRFLKTLRAAQREASNYVGRESAWKFSREETYRERLDRQMPR